MTDPQTTEFAVTVLHEPTTLTVRVAGDLDYDTSDDLIGTVVEHLAAGGARPHGVRMDFRHLTWIDSTGLSALLMIHRRTAAAGVTLHLDNRPDVLERMLRLTNVLDHLTAPASRGEPSEYRQDDGFTGASAT
ncbi:STAS domain-containing protein [Streptomyces sp. NPDC020298]|uniref:STAS domain-containing protein n=1 Tax=unclassified Streptomyces TaxID=2593676 RepID=UPI0033D428AD